MTTTRIKLRGPVDNTPAAAFIDMTPTWAGIMPALVAALQDGTPDGRRIARAELARLAEEVDSANAAARKAREEAAAAPVPAGQASHLKTATAALAGVLADMSRQNDDSATRVASASRHAAFMARAHAFAHAAATAADRGGNDSKALKARAEELADSMAAALADADREHNARAEEVAELNRAVVAAEEGAAELARHGAELESTLAASRAARHTVRRCHDAARDAMARALAELESPHYGDAETRADHAATAADILRDALAVGVPAAVTPAEGDHVFSVRFTVPAEELETYRKGASPVSAMAGILQRDLYDESGMSGQFDICDHAAPGEELADSLAGAAELAAIREHARDAAAMLETYANGRQNNESRGQALATVRAIRAAL